MKQEDIEFLRELQHELNTQEHDGQAAPRYWGIAQRIEKPCPEGCGDTILYVGDGGVMTCEEFVDFIENNNYQDGHADEWEEVYKCSESDLAEFANDVLGWSDVRVVYQETDYHYIGEDSNVFLTKRACLAHLSQNHYHYKKGHTYAMTAWRNPEFERLMNILQTMNIDEIPVTDGKS